MGEYGMPALMIGGGLTALFFGGEILLRGAVCLAALMQISPLVIGLTVVALGTSAPELAVSVQAALDGQADIAVGNVVGSNIFNILFILGVSAMVAPLTVAPQLLRLDVPVMIVTAGAVFVLGQDGNVSQIDGIGLFLTMLFYTGWIIRKSRKEEKAAAAALDPALVEEVKADAKTGPLGIAIAFLQIAGGIALLTIGAGYMVEGSVTIAKLWGISELVIGLTIIAAGTSLPEVAASVMATIRGHRDIAVGNVVGSNILNVLCVLGVTSAVAPKGVNVSTTALTFDIPVMIGISIAAFPIFMTGRTIARWEGALFFAYYLAYVAYLVLEATQSPYSGTFNQVMISGVLPATVLLLLLLLFRGNRAKE